jgi:hypothetical protein
MSRSQENVAEAYAGLANELATKIETAPSLDRLVNFHDNATMPVHRWYYFKEGYSHQLVKKLLAEFGVKENSLVLDPFAGSGTTLLTAQWQGMHPVGIDINPFFTFVQRTKLDWFKYDLMDLEETIDGLAKINCEIPVSLELPKLSSFSRDRGAVFSSETLDNLLCFKEQISNLDDGLTKNFVRLGLASILESVSLIKKDGKGLKFVKGKKPPSVRIALLKKLREMLSDLMYVKHASVDGSSEIGKINGETFNFDTRSAEEFEKHLPESSVDSVIFSPPYLNTFDYTEVYKLELWFLDFVKNYDDYKNLRSRTLRSHNLWKWKPTRTWQNEALGLVVDRIREEKLWTKIIPVMIQGYFDDMFLSLRNLNKVMRNGACCVIVVGNSSYGNIPIATDLLLTKAAKDAHLEPVEIRIARRLATSSQQLKTLKDPELRNYLRESVIILRKVD